MNVTPSGLTFSRRNSSFPGSCQVIAALGALRQLEADLAYENCPLDPTADGRGACLGNRGAFANGQKEPFKPEAIRILL